MTTPSSPAIRQAFVELSRCVSLRRNPQYVSSRQLGALVESIQRDGFLAPVLLRPLDDGSFEVLSGNHRVMAAREAGLSEIPALIGEFSDTAVGRIAVNLNTIHGDPLVGSLAPFLADLDDEVLSDVYLSDSLIGQIGEWDAELQETLRELAKPPASIDNAPESAKLPSCVCKACGRRHVPT